MNIEWVAQANGNRWGPYDAQQSRRRYRQDPSPHRAPRRMGGMRRRPNSKAHICWHFAWVR
jgi:hypothetical protein